MSRPDMTALLKDIDEHQHETAGERSSSLFKRYPSVAIGLTGAGLILLYQIREFKNRGNMRISDYLIHTRLYTQGFFILSFTIGAAWEVSKFYRKKYSQPETPAAITEDPTK